MVFPRDMNLLLTGVTGVAGLAIYRAALADAAIANITVLTRRPIPEWAVLPANASAKTAVIVHSDFRDYPPELARRLAAHDACIWALGRSSNGAAEAEYTAVTHDFPLAAARALQAGGAGEGRTAANPFRFVYISGHRADPTERSSMMWARVKGRAERALIELMGGSEGTAAHVYRPRYFFPSAEYPQDRANQRTSFLRGLDTVMTPLFSVLAPSWLSPIDDMASYSVAIAKGEWPIQTVFTNQEMRRWAQL